jgi:rRNA-processing protein FCF1
MFDIDEKVTYITIKSNVAFVITKDKRIKSIAKNVLKITVIIMITNTDTTLV